ncbi:MAG: glycosyltransferase family 2 protein [Ktedonobacterales bacterium]
MVGSFALLALAALEGAFGARVAWRLICTAGGVTIAATDGAIAADNVDDKVTIVLPVLNERLRVAPCLDGLLAQGPAARDILVVDGGSSDGTQALVAQYAARDARIRLLDASPIPPEWNGKAWGLHVGELQSDPSTRWLLTIDADVFPAAPLTDALLAHAWRSGDVALSVATRQRIEGLGEALLHPALLTTLVYRFGAPGRSTGRVRAVQANGQCMLLRRDALAAVGGFAAVSESICEDVTLARLLAARGYAVGFYEAGDLVSTRMYAGWRETWRNWTRSLPLRDRYFGFSGWLGLLEVTFAQAAPLPTLAALATYGGWLALSHRAPALLEALALGGAAVLLAGLLALRLGTLAGIARAYVRRPWSFWFSPLCDAPVAVRLWVMALRRRHSWRGRAIVRTTPAMPR